MAEKSISINNSLSSPNSPTTVSTEASSKPQPFYDVESGKEQRNIRGFWRLLECFSRTTEEEKQRNSRRDEAITETEVLSIDQCPEGYPQAAAFLSSEPNFSLYRGFSYLFSRVLLNLQDEIVELEEKLSELDNIQAYNNESDRLQSRRTDMEESDGEAESHNRKIILSQIQSKLNTYSEILQKAREVASFHKPSNRDYRSVRTWFWNTSSLVDPESEFIKHKEDIISLHNGREWSAFDEIVEKLLLFPQSSWLRKVFSTPELQRKTADQAVHYYSRSRVEYFVSLIITSIIFVLLVVPVVVMYKMTSVSKSQHAIFTAIAVLIVFTLLFSAAMAALTVARRHEIFAATAAYCAVLVVFISNFGPQS